MATMQQWSTTLMAVAITTAAIPLVGCGGGGSSSKPTALTAAETAGVAGSWSGTWTEAGVAATFAATIDCVGNLTATLTPSGGAAESIEGTVNTWNATTGAFAATLTRGGDSHTLTGVVNGRDLTGSFESDAGTTGNFIVSLAGNALICTAAQIAELDSVASVTSDLTSTVSTSTCQGTGATPYTSDAAILLKPHTGGGVDMIMTFAPTATTAQVGLIGTTTDTGSELHFAAVGTIAGDGYLANLAITSVINGDGTLQGSFTGTVDADGDGLLTGANDCSALSGTLTGTKLVE